MGIGMSLVMTEFSEILGLHRELAMPVGIIIGFAGIILVCMAYPVYNFILRKQREKIAPEIIRLTDELMK